MIVVDTNLVAYLLLNSEKSAEAEQVLRRDPEWAAPLLWRSELRNVLASQVRAGHLRLADAQEAMSQAEDLLQGREYSVASVHVLKLAAESGCTAYDCEFVALARDLGVQLVTYDHSLLSAFPDRAVSPELL